MIKIVNKNVLLILALSACGDSNDRKDTFSPTPSSHDSHVLSLVSYLSSSLVAIANRASGMKHFDWSTGTECLQFGILLGRVHQIPEAIDLLTPFLKERDVSEIRSETAKMSLSGAAPSACSPENGAYLSQRLKEIEDSSTKIEKVVASYYFSLKK